MRVIFLFIISIFIFGCTSEEQKLSEKFIKETTEINWDDGIPLDDLLYAINVCKAHSDYKGCNEVDEQVADISVSLKTCLVDQRSRLCQALVLVISKHPIYKSLPTSDAVVLPQTPFYWSLPTKALDAQASNFGYRSESISWWWGKCGIVIWLLTIFLLFAFGLYRYWIFRQKIQLEIALENQAKIAHQLDQEKLIAKQAQQARRIEAVRVEAEKEVELAKQELIEEENRIALEEKLANEKAEKLAKEKADADALLNAVFKRKK
jgi:hypothetical protein